MKVLIVTYDLKTPHLNYDRLVQKIRSYKGWARLGASSYLILTDSTVVQVRDNLVSIAIPGDQIFVGTCPVPAAWWGVPEDVAKWILENQPKNS